MIRTTKLRGRPKRRHSEGIGNHSSKKPRTASVEVTLPADTSSTYNLPSASSSIMSEVVNVILAQVASQQRQQQQQQSLADELQDNVELVAAPPPSNELIIIENSLDSTNTVEVWAGGEGGGGNVTGEVNEILERIGAGQPDSVEGEVMVTEATTEQVVSQEIITDETPCEEPVVTTTSVVTSIPDSGHDIGTGSNDPPNDIVTSGISEQVTTTTNESDQIDKSTPSCDDTTTSTSDVILPHTDDITTANNNDTVVHDNA